jgi:hypothetical protein
MPSVASAAVNMAPQKRKARACPGFSWREIASAYSAKIVTGFAIRIRAKMEADQAAGLNSFDALALIGSTVSVATFWVSSASSLDWAVKASNCLRA